MNIRIEFVFFENLLTIISIGVSIFIAYHIFFLSKRITFKDKLAHYKAVEKLVKEILGKIYDAKQRNRVYIVDIDMYDKYPSNDSGRYSHIAGGLKDSAIDGVEIVLFETETVQHISGDKYRKAKDGTDRAYRIGVIPYERIIDFKLDGDGANNSPLIYCKFKPKWVINKNRPIKIAGIKIPRLQKEWFPFAKYRYYRKNPNYDSRKNYYWEIYSEPIRLLD